MMEELPGKRKRSDPGSFLWFDPSAIPRAPFQKGRIVMKLGILWVFTAIAGFAAALGAEPQPATTQGAFAVELATRLGLGDGATLGETDAIEALSRGGIHPDAGWYPEGPATELFVVQIQKSVHALLERVSRDLAIPVPPTLSLQVLSTEPLAGQTIYFEPREFRRTAPPVPPPPSTSASPEGPEGPESSGAPPQTRKPKR
jgi:hypothetical protein